MLRIEFRYKDENNGSYDLDNFEHHTKVRLMSFLLDHFPDDGGEGLEEISIVIDDLEAVRDWVYGNSSVEDL